MQLDLVWVIYRANSNFAHKEARNCVKSLEEKNIKVLSAISGQGENPFPSLFSNSKKLPNLAIVLGGDGTVLGAARNLSIHQIPILTFNVGGNVGFLSHDRSFLEYKTLWERIQQDRYKIDKRMMLDANLKNPSKEEIKCIALNDFYFHADRDEVSPTCTLAVEIDEEAVNQYRGDGLILSTPTGSTGYSMATGGPILHPRIEAIIISAICPMSLASRPVIVPADSTVSIKSIGDKNRQVRLWKDGSSVGLLQPGGICSIKKAKHNTQLMVLEDSPSYFKTISQKLHWEKSLINNQMSI
tara:strand:- start:502 stop:1398 length:897 start_codon:yes stop_codon:yes gene_type:complete